MLTERQSGLLKLIVEEYIKTIKPIGSKSLMETMDLSSATIRNEMAILEEKKYIEKTHISSGRIPSEKGYRYYVDNIMSPKELTGADMLSLQTIFKNNKLELSDAITKSMKIVTELTNYTAVVLGQSSKHNKISKVEAIPLSNNKFTTILVTDKGHVEHKNIILEETISPTEIQKTVDIINKLIIGTPLDEVAKKLEFEVKPVINKYIKQHAVLYNAFYEAFTEFADAKDVKFTGTNNILEHHEFSEVEKVKSIINKFDDSEFIKNIETDNADENHLKVYIGSETNMDDDITIIKTNYIIDGSIGTIALIGPKRMEYERVTSLLNYIKENIER